MFLIRVVLLILIVSMMYSSACFSTLMERKILGYVQNRKGPNKLIFFGLIQPVVDGGKLTMKIIKFDLAFFLISFVPIVCMSALVLVLHNVMMMLVPSNFFIYLLFLSALMVYAVFMLGWNSDSVYSMMGGLRSSSQTVAHDVILFFSIIFFPSFFPMYNPKGVMVIFYTVDLFVLRVIAIMIETNRSPYDFAEGESELVSGFNIEYMGVLFAFLFISEHGALIFPCRVSGMSFVNWIMSILLAYLTSMIRGFIPRSRYDVMTNTCWKSLPVSLSFLILKFLSLCELVGSLKKMIDPFLLDLASPKNLLWWWNFGFMLGMSMIIQVVSGLLSALFYCDFMVYASNSVEYTMDEVESGSLSRFIHSSGASVIFFLISMHTGRSIWYKSYFMKEVWMTGVVIFLVLTMVSLSGYASPWGQMPLWAATVITNSSHVSPYWGSVILEWVWGGFSVGGSTLPRLFVLHYIVPFVISGLSAIHLIYLHVEGSSNPVGLMSGLEKIEFYWYYLPKDFAFLVMFSLTPILFAFSIPFTLMDSENFPIVDFMKTPEHIKPEWYFLSAYCTLRSIPNKIGGVTGPVMSILVLFLIPLMKMIKFKFVDLFIVGVNSSLFFGFRMLTWLGGCIVEWPYSFLGMTFSILYSFMML